MTDMSKSTDDQINVSVRYPMDAPINGRIYPAHVMEAALERAKLNGTLQVTVSPDPLTGRSSSAPIQLGNKRFLNPKFTLNSMSMNDDGSLSGSFNVEERAGVVDRLADVARADAED